MDTSIDARLTRLEAIEAVKQLKARYLNACDKKDIERMRSCFAEGEVHIDYGAVGSFTHRDGLIGIFEKMGGGENIIDLHHGQNAEIEVQDATHASADWGLFFYQIDTKTQQLSQLGGHYQDEYVKVEGQWRISSTTFRVHSSYVAKLSDGEQAQQLQVLFAGGQPTF